MSGCFLTNRVEEVGVAPASFRDHNSVTFHFHNFKDLSAKKGESVSSRKKRESVSSRPFTAFNHKWQLELFPGGVKELPQDEPWVTLSLYKLSKGSMKVNYWYILRNTAGEIITEAPCVEVFDEPGEGEMVHRWGWTTTFVKRSTVLDSDNVLNNGTFTVELRMTPADAKFCTNMIPKNPFSSLMSKLWLDEESADVCFAVKSTIDETKPTVKLYAHRLVLKACAQDLARLCEGCDKSENPVTITDVEPQVFRQLLRYVYGGHMDETDWETHSKAFIDAANKYHVTNLKVEAEAWYVNYFDFTVDNVADELLYADAKSCSLLKEAAVNFIVDNGIDVYSSDSFKKVLKADGITQELLMAMAKKLAISSNTEDAVDYSSMSVNDLRRKLEECGLDVDGSREMLVHRLEDDDDDDVNTDDEDGDSDEADTDADEGEVEPDAQGDE